MIWNWLYLGILEQILLYVMTTDCTRSLHTTANWEEGFDEAPEDVSDRLCFEPCFCRLMKICTCYGMQQEGEVLHVYLDWKSQHHLMSCMRMKTCMKMVAV